jgi:hypothetical protein
VTHAADVSGQLVQLGIVLWEAALKLTKQMRLLLHSASAGFEEHECQPRHSHVHVSGLDCTVAEGFKAGQHRISAFARSAAEGHELRETAQT